MMPFIRFESDFRIQGTGYNQGIFQLAYHVRDATETMTHDKSAMEQHIDWLKMHLHSPYIANEDFRAIFWFKDRAREPLKRIWSLKHIIEEYGYRVHLKKSYNPGNIIYEDGWQVAAKPWRKKGKRQH